MSSIDIPKNNEDMRHNGELLGVFFRTLHKVLEDVTFDPDQADKLGNSFFTKQTESGVYTVAEAGESVKVPVEIVYNSTPVGPAVAFVLGEMPDIVTVRVEFYPRGTVEDEEYGLIQTDIRRSAKVEDRVLPKETGLSFYKRLPELFQSFVNEIDEPYKFVVDYDKTMAFDKWYSKFGSIVSSYEQTDMTEGHQKWSHIFEPQ